MGWNLTLLSPQSINIWRTTTNPKTFLCRRRVLPLLSNPLDASQNPYPHGTDPLRESTADGPRDGSSTLRRAIHDARSRLAAIQGRGGFFAENRFLAECEALRGYAIATGLRNDFPLIATQAGTRGYEHEVWIKNVPPEVPPRVWKATYPDEFGHLPQGIAAQPIQYLERLLYQNLIFHDDIRLEGISFDGDADFFTMRMVTSQPFVSGQPGSPEEIERFFQEQGFRNIRMKRRNGWFRDEDGLLCSDTHGGNLLRSEDGRLIAIDVPVICLSPAELAPWLV